MIEVEAKIKLSDPRKTRALVKKLGAFVHKEKKVDDYYTLESLSSYPKKSLRVRHRSGFFEINFKRRISYKKGIHAKNEVEFNVSDIKRFLSLLKNFGFKKWLCKEKTTELYEIQKNFHIEINNVKGLGWFVEVEYLTTPNNIQKARNQVFSMLKKLGASKKDLIKDGYTKLLWKKKKS